MDRQGQDVSNIPLISSSTSAFSAAAVFCYLQPLRTLESKYTLQTVMKVLLVTRFPLLWGVWIPLWSAVPFVSAQTTTPANMAPCPGADGTLFTNSDGHTYRIYCQQDTVPGATSTDSTGAITSFTQCMSLCSRTSGCNVVSFSSPSTCYLKSSFTGTVSGKAVTFASATRFDAPYPAPDPNNVNKTTGCGNALPAGVTPGITTSYINFTDSNGIVRQYTIHVPLSYNVNNPAPLIMTFHGHAATSQQHEGESGWSTESWNPYGIVVYPQGLVFAGAVRSSVICKQRELMTSRRHG